MTGLLVSKPGLTRNNCTDPAGVVDETKVSLVSEVRFLVFGMLVVLSSKLLYQGLIGRFREPTFLVHQG